MSSVDISWIYVAGWEVPRTQIPFASNHTAMSSVIPHPPSAEPERGLLRTRGGHEHSKVTFIELFFDLVFVFAVTQLSHSLMEHFTPVGAVQTLLLMLAVWWVWIYTSWVTNWLDPEKLPVRFLLLGIMLAGLVMSASLPMAFESRGIAFATAYVVIQVGRTIFFLWAVKGRPGMVRNFQRILTWLVLAGIFWIAGAFAHGPGRLALWVIALGLDYISPSLAFGFRVLDARARATGTSRAVTWPNGARFSSLSPSVNPSW